MGKNKKMIVPQQKKKIKKQNNIKPVTGYYVHSFKDANLVTYDMKIPPKHMMTKANEEDPKNALNFSSCIYEQLEMYEDPFWFEHGDNGDNPYPTSQCAIDGYNHVPIKPYPSLKCGSDLSLVKGWDNMANTSPYGTFAEFTLQNLDSDPGNGSTYRGGCYTDQYTNSAKGSTPYGFQGMLSQFIGFENGEYGAGGVVGRVYGSDMTALTLWEIQLCYKADHQNPYTPGNPKPICPIWTDYQGQPNMYFPDGIIDDEQFYQLMLTYCLTMKKSAPQDGNCPFSGTLPNKNNDICPNYLKTDTGTGNPDGKTVCAAFMKDPKNAGVIDAFVRQICTTEAFRTTQQCDCLSAPSRGGNYSDIYQYFVNNGDTGIGTQEDSCWFPPCMDGYHLMTSAQMNQDITKCQTVNCANIIQEGINPKDLVVATQICCTGSSADPKNKTDAPVCGGGSKPVPWTPVLPPTKNHPNYFTTFIKFIIVIIILYQIFKMISSSSR